MLMIYLAENIVPVNFILFHLPLFQMIREDLQNGYMGLLPHARKEMV
jgi:hypothetical protein